MIKLLVSVLWNYEDSLRATGRTTRLIEEARRTDAIIVCHNYSFAQQVAYDYNVRTMGLEKYLYDERDTRGRSDKDKPKYLFDSPAEIRIIKMKLKEAQDILDRRPV